MPKLELTMNQWGLVLRAVRFEMAAAEGLYADEVKEEDMKELRTIEDRIIDLAFRLAKEIETDKQVDKPFFCPVGQKL